MIIPPFDPIRGSNAGRIFAPFRRFPGQSLRPEQAFSLIEMIAVLAIIAILAATVLPVLLRQLDYASQANEATNLLAIATSLQQGALRQRFVPSQNDWASFTATNLGWQVSAVQTNLRNNPRVFLIDPTLVIASGTLPYQQNNQGSTNLPTNPRMIIMSSLSSPFPSGLTSSVPSVADFNALWASTDDTIPTGTSWTWSTWKGQGSDIKIQRINLAPSFYRLILTVADATNAVYSIDNSTVATVTNGAPLSTYFLAGTVFKLYVRSSGTTNLAVAQVLAGDTSFVFQSGVWRLDLGPALPSPSGNSLYGDYEFIVQQFRTNACNPLSGWCPSTVFSRMTNWLALYNAYAAGNFSSSSLKTQLNAVQAQLDLDVGTSRLSD
jgi:prepilin-type N-terminal cleavage/methylation domain-containing protein